MLQALLQMYQSAPGRRLASALAAPASSKCFFRAGQRHGARRGEDWSGQGLGLMEASTISSYAQLWAGVYSSRPTAMAGALFGIKRINVPFLQKRPPMAAVAICCCHSCGC